MKKYILFMLIFVLCSSAYALDVSLIYPLNETVFYPGVYNGSVILTVSNDVGLVSASINDSRFSLQYSENRSNYCYQESANRSTSCGGLANGSYSFDGTFGDWKNMIDEDYNTYSYQGSSLSYECVYMNYSIPKQALNATWRVKTGGGSLGIVDINYTLPGECWNINNKLLLRNCHYKTGGGSYRYRFGCSNGTEYNTIESDFAVDIVDRRFYEEGIVWLLNGTDNTYIFTTQTTQQNYTLEAFFSDDVETKNITFWFYQNTTLNISIYNEENNNLITDLINIDIVGDNNIYNFSTTNGIIVIGDIQPDTYNIRISSDDYRVRNKEITIEPGTVTDITMYTINKSQTTNTILRVIDQDSSVVENVKIVILRQSGSSYVNINELYTNFEGETISDFELNTINYKFQFWYNDMLIDETNPTLIFQSELTHQISLTADELTSLKYFLGSYGRLTDIYNKSGFLCVDYIFSGGDNIKAAKVIVTSRVLSSNDIIITSNETSQTYGTLTACWVPENNIRYFIEGYIDTNTASSWYVTDVKEYFNSTSVSVLGLFGIFITLIIVGSMATLNTEHASMTIAMTVLALGLCSFIGFINITWGYLVLIASVGGIIMFSRVK